MAVSSFCLPLIMFLIGGYAAFEGEEKYRYVVELTGISGLLTIIPCVLFYKEDCRRRVYGRLVPSPPGSRVSVPQASLLLMMGAALSLYGNLLMLQLSRFVHLEEYSAEMELVGKGKSLPLMIIWLGIAAPIAEEVVFRWLVYLRLRDQLDVVSAVLISSLIFGVYHGNLAQMVYASLLGVVFALVLEMTGNLWSSMLLHVGANVFSLLLERLINLTRNMSVSVIGGIYIALFTGFLIVLAGGIKWAVKRGLSRGYRAL